MKRLWIPLSILSVISLTVLYFGVTLAQPKPLVEEPATVVGLLAAVNAERAKVGVSPLVLDDKLMESAQWKAEKMVETGNFAHVDPSTGENDGLEYLLSLKPNCGYVSENWTGFKEKDRVATNSTSMNWWLNSKPHREAMLDPKYTSTGFGVTNYAIVQHFCQP